MTLLQRPPKLFTPGPVNIPERVHLAPILASYHHRVPEFSQILWDTLSMLQPLFGTKQLVMPVHTTGRGALEGAYNNVLGKTDKVLSVANGNFGEMAIKTLKRIGVDPIACFSGWESEVDIEVLEQLIVEHKPIAITAVHNDTSNGVVNPISAIGELAQKYDLLFIVDTVSGLGCMPFKMDEWGVDVAVTASQKGLMSPAGISFVAMSQKALEACEKTNSSDFYINFLNIRKNIISKRETPGTTPVSLVVSVHEALRMIHEEGLGNVFNRHRVLSLSTKAAVKALGFELFPFNCDLRSDALTVCKLPLGVSAPLVRSLLRKEYSIEVGIGLGSYSEEVMRISNMGYYFVEDMIQFIAALEAVLDDFIPSRLFGVGLSEFNKTYNSMRS